MIALWDQQVLKLPIKFCQAPLCFRTEQLKMCSDLEILFRRANSLQQSIKKTFNLRLKETQVKAAILLVSLFDQVKN